MHIRIITSHLFLKVINLFCSLYKLDAIHGLLKGLHLLFQSLKEVHDLGVGDGGAVPASQQGATNLESGMAEVDAVVHLVVTTRWMVRNHVTYDGQSLSIFLNARRDHCRSAFSSMRKDIW